MPDKTAHADYFAYLELMKSDKIVQFVCFETTLDLSTDQFITHWEQYTRSANSDVNVTLQRSRKNGLFKYVAQHRLPAGGAQFVFEKARRSSRVPEMEMKARHAGGYSVLQSQRAKDAHEDETKIFAFLSHAPFDLDSYRLLAVQGKLNIYEAYFENCRYAYILEFFMKDKDVPELLEQLKINKADEIGIYKEFALQES
jgi:hypothetical protein